MSNDSIKTATKLTVSNDKGILNYTNNATSVTEFSAPTLTTISESYNPALSIGNGNLPPIRIGATDASSSLIMGVKKYSGSDVSNVPFIQGIAYFAFINFLTIFVNLSLYSPLAIHPEFKQFLIYLISFL